MGILNWLTSKLKPMAQPVSLEPVKRNLGLEYVQDKTGLDITAYRKIAHMVNDHACAAAEEFARFFGEKPTDQLVHYFHDMFIAVCILPNMRKLSADDDTASAIVDGIHFEFYENASPAVVESILQVLAEKPTCFFQTFVKGRGGNGRTVMRFAQMAACCIDADRVLGAPNSFQLPFVLMRIVKEKGRSICTALDIMLDI